MNWLNPSNVGSEKDTQTSTVNGYLSTLERNKEIKLTDNARKVLEKRYLRKDEKGSIAETVEEMFERVAKTVAAPDASYRDVKRTEVEFYNLLTTKKFFPNSPSISSA